MKNLVLYFLLLSLLNGDEIKRIESIVEDITKLRVQYEECKDELEAKESAKASENYKIVAKLKKEIKNYKKIIKSKDIEIDSLKKEKIALKSYKHNSSDVNKVLCLDKPNDFPKLVLKDKYIDKNIEKVIKTKPSTYRLVTNADIYDSIDGDRVEEWESGTSFTSNVKTDSWVKITGFFINRVWVKSRSSMWVKLSDVIKR